MMYTVPMNDTESFPQLEANDLHQVELFQGLSLPELTTVLQAGRQRVVPQDAFFFHQGDQATALYMLIRGRVRMTQVTPEGQQVILRIINPGEMFGGIAALGDTSYPAAAQALEASAALLWESDSMMRLMEEHPRIGLNALRLLAGRYQDLQDRYRELATERVERRVARALLRLLRQTGRKVEEGVLIDFPLSQEDLAELTGTTRFTISRILSHWEKQGLVDTGRQRILIRIPHQLVVIADDLKPDSPSNSL